MVVVVVVVSMEFGDEMLVVGGFVERGVGEMGCGCWGLDMYWNTCTSQYRPSLLLGINGAPMCTGCETTAVTPFIYLYLFIRIARSPLKGR
jgi:hypothetical protein